MNARIREYITFSLQKHALTHARHTVFSDVVDVNKVIGRGEQVELIRERADSELRPVLVPPVLRGVEIREREERRSRKRSNEN